MEDLETKKTVKSGEPEKANGAKDKTKLYFILSGVLLAAFLLLIVLLKTVDVKTVTLELPSGNDYDGGAKVSIELGSFAKGHEEEFENTYSKFLESKGFKVLNRMQISESEGSQEYEFRLEYSLNGKRIDKNNADEQLMFQQALTGDDNDAVDKGIQGALQKDLTKDGGFIKTYNDGNVDDYQQAEDFIKAYVTGVKQSFDIEIGLAGLNIAVSNAIKFNSVWYKITGVLGILPLIIACAFVVFGVVQLVMRKSLKRGDGEIYLLGGLYVLTFIIYIFFEKVIINYRPVILDKAPEASFPSSHTVLSLVICLSASFMLEKYVKKQAVLHGMQIALGALAAFIVLGRILAGVHWLTDILGGLLISLALYYAFKALNLKLFGKRAE